MEIGGEIKGREVGSEGGEGVNISITRRNLKYKHDTVLRERTFFTTIFDTIL